MIQREAELFLIKCPPAPTSPSAPDCVSSGEQLWCTVISPTLVLSDPRIVILLCVATALSNNLLLLLLQKQVSFGALSASGILDLRPSCLQPASQPGRSIISGPAAGRGNDLGIGIRNKGSGAYGRLYLDLVACLNYVVTVPGYSA